MAVDPKKLAADPRKLASIQEKLLLLAVPGIDSEGADPKQKQEEQNITVLQFMKLKQKEVKKQAEVKSQAELEGEDEEYREHFLSAMTEFAGKDPSLARLDLEKLGNIFEIYAKISKKTPVDHSQILVIFGKIYALLQATQAPLDERLKWLEKEDTLVKALKACNPAYGDLELLVLIDKAHLLLQSHSRDERIDGMLMAVKFCTDIKKLKEHCLYKKFYHQLFDLKRDLREKIKEEATNESILETVKEMGNVIFDNWFLLNKELNDLFEGLDFESPSSKPAKS